MPLITVAAATLFNIPLDFDGNLKNIKNSIALARKAGATLRTGPELEISGYGCLDHFLEHDTFEHSLEVLVKILEDPNTKGMLIDVGMPIKHRNARYICRVLCTYRHIYCIRPKSTVANDGMYREARYFTAWTNGWRVEDYALDQAVQDVTSQQCVPIGNVIFSACDAEVAFVTFEDLMIPLDRSVRTCMSGVKIILNSSACYVELDSMKRRFEVISNAAHELGGIFIHTNATGVDGDARMLFDGGSIIMANGDLVAQAARFPLPSVSISVATIDVGTVNNSKLQKYFHGIYEEPQRPRVKMNDLFLCRTTDISVSPRIKAVFYNRMEEIHYATGSWLWQYLVQSNSAGYFLALSGGVDSCTVALLVFGMAKLVLASIQAGESCILSDFRRLTGDTGFTPEQPQEIVSRLFHTCYMGTRNSTKDTRARASSLARAIGAYHSDINIDDAITAHEDIIEKTLNYKPTYSCHGGFRHEDVARQNIQARNRMVVGYELAQLSTTARDLPRRGVPLLTLGAGNCAEHLRGYFTKYDASSADISPIGSLSKSDIWAFQRWAREYWNLPILSSIIAAKPTSELQPHEAGFQDDESDNEMGMTYNELTRFGVLRKTERLGPWSAYQELLNTSKGNPSPQKIAEKVCRFYQFWAINRHKSTVLTPSLHLSSYNPEDNRHDPRPFLYNFKWSWQFEKIRENAIMQEATLKARFLPSISLSGEGSAP